MTDTTLSITGPDVIDILKDMSRRRAPADKISQVYFQLRASVNGNLDAESLEAAEKILSGVAAEERNLSQEVRDWVCLQDGYFLITDVYNHLHLITRLDKVNVAVILNRLNKEKLIERYGNRRGSFRRINDDMESIDFINVTEEEISLTLPFDIQKMIKLMPKNIIVIAGEPNAGKTAFLLNVARENQHAHDIHYFSSEMGPLETRERLTKFANYPLSAWKTKFWERSSDFADVIRPNSINIIDFLEVHTDFWAVGGLIKAIFDNLDKGIALIAIQKNQTKKLKDGTTTGDYGLGGARGLEKPRLYLTMSGSHILKIVKAKNWRTDKNPNGLQINFKLANGCYFSSKGGWYRDEGKYNGLVHERQPGEED